MLPARYYEGLITTKLSSLYCVKGGDLAPSDDEPTFPINICTDQLTLEDIRRQIPSQATIQIQDKDEEPPMITGVVIRCLSNHTQVKRAQEAGAGSDASCTVRLFCVPPTKLHPTDGEFFRNIIFYRQQKRYHLAEEWLNSLSGPKKAHFNMLDRRPQIMDAMKRLLPFRGIWHSLQLGNWAKHLGAHCDQLIVNYLTHVYAVWKSITDDLDLSIVDDDLVKNLQYLVPSRSCEDRKIVSALFEDEGRFPKLSDSQRRILKQNILKQTHLIPSIQTFHENMRYLTLAFKALEKFICTDRRKRRLGGDEKRFDLFETLRSDWRPRTVCFQIGERTFAESAESAEFESIAIDLFLTAVRHFPYISHQGPLQDERWRPCCMSEGYRRLLCETASRLGFHNTKISEGCRISASVVEIPSEISTTKQSWRGGIPRFSTFCCLQQSLFLPRLLQRVETSEEPPLTWVAWDIIQTFFGKELLLPQSAVITTVLDRDATMDDSRAETETNTDLTLQPDTEAPRLLAASSRDAAQRMEEQEMGNLTDGSRDETATDLAPFPFHQFADLGPQLARSSAPSACQGSRLSTLPQVNKIPVEPILEVPEGYGQFRFRPLRRAVEPSDPNTVSVHLSKRAHGQIDQPTEEIDGPSASKRTRMVAEAIEDISKELEKKQGEHLEAWRKDVLEAWEKGTDGVVEGCDKCLKILERLQVKYSNNTDELHEVVKWIHGVAEIRQWALAPSGLEERTIKLSTEFDAARKKALWDLTQRGKDQVNSSDLGIMEEEQLGHMKSRLRDELAEFWKNTLKTTSESKEKLASFSEPESPKPFSSLALPAVGANRSVAPIIDQQEEEEEV